MRAGRWVLIVAIALAAAHGARATDTLTAPDLAWLQHNLNLSADSPVIATLDAAHKTRLHALIGRAHGGDDRRRQAVANFITGTVGGGFEETLRQSLQATPNPIGAAAGR